MIKPFWDRRPRRLFKSFFKAIPSAFVTMLVLLLSLSAVVAGVENWNATTLIQAFIGLLVMFVLALVVWGVWYGIGRWIFEKITPKVNLMNWGLSGLLGGVGLWVMVQNTAMPGLILGLWCGVIAVLGAAHTFWSYPAYQVKIRTRMVDVEDEEP